MQQNKEYQKDYSLLRPFDLEEAENEEFLCDIHGNNTYVMTDFTIRNSTKEITLDVKSIPYNYEYPRVTTDFLRMKPLAWVEGKPVYKGDVLYNKKYSKYKYTVSHVYGDSIFTIPNETGFYSETADNLTWNKPRQKVKRKVWINVYPENYSYAPYCYWSKDEAERSAASELIACVETEIEYEMQ